METKGSVAVEEMMNILGAMKKGNLRDALKKVNANDNAMK